MPREEVTRLLAGLEGQPSRVGSFYCHSKLPATRPRAVERATKTALFIHSVFLPGGVGRLLLPVNDV
jgi:hypothetical protein